MTTDGYDAVLSARKEGKGCILALPHLGSWEWAGFWMTRVERHPMTVVVERLEPPGLFDWFADLRRRFGFEVVPLGPDAGRACMAALRDNHVLSLLCDRDIGGGGVEVEFFGERTTLPGGPATLALRTGAPLLPTAVYNQGDAPACRHPSTSAGRASRPPARRRRTVDPGPRPRAGGPHRSRSRAVAPHAAELAQRPPDRAADQGQSLAAPPR